MNLFQIVKSQLRTRDVALFYGIEVNHSGKALCPFHDDHHPSLFVDDTHYHCYGCQAHGDVINLTANLFDLTNTDAARKLIADFHLDPDKPLPESIKQKIQIQTEAQRLRENENLCFSVLAEYRQLLRDWKKCHVPVNPTDEPDQRYTQACRSLAWVEYHLDFLITGEPGERTEVVNYFLEDNRIHRLKDCVESIRREERHERKETAPAL